MARRRKKKAKSMSPGATELFDGVGETQTKTLSNTFEALQSSSPFGSYFSQAELTELSRTCSIVSVKKGRELPISPFYLVLKGTVVAAETEFTNGPIRNPLFGDPEAVRGLWRPLCNMPNFFSHVSAIGEADDEGGRHGATAWRGHRSSVASINDKGDEKETIFIAQEASRVLMVRFEDRLERLYADLSSEARMGYDAVVHSNVIAHLSAVPFIRDAHLDSEDLRIIGGDCSYQALRPGQYLYAQGDPATAFYVLLKGACQVMVNRKVVRGSEDRPSERDNVSERRKSSTTELMEARASHAGATRGRGFFRNNTKAEWENSSVPLEGVGPLRQVGEPIGYAPLVVGQPTRLTGMQAIEPTLFLMVDKVHFERAMEAHTTTLKPCVLRMTLNNVLNRYALEPTSFFHAFQEEEIERAAIHATLWKIKAGETVYNRGDPAKAFYFVLHGEVSRDYLDGSESRVIPRGSYFGEMGLLLPRTPCLATVTVVKDSTLLTISIENWSKVVTQIDHKTAHDLRTEELRSLWPLGYDDKYESRKTSHSAVRAARSKRDLHFTLQVQLLLRLRREATPLGAILLHPKACAALFDFTHHEVLGGLRAGVFWPSLRLLQRVRLAAGIDRKVSTSTESVVIDFIMEQFRELVHVLERSPCPDPSTVVAAPALPPPPTGVSRVRFSPREGSDAAPVAAPPPVAALRMAPLMEGELHLRLSALHRLEQRVVEQVRRNEFEASDLEGILNHLCAAQVGLLELAYSNFVASEAFDELMDLVYPVDEDVAKRVDERDIDEILKKVELASPTADVRPTSDMRGAVPTALAEYVPAPVPAPAPAAVSEATGGRFTKSKRAFSLEIFGGGNGGSLLGNMTKV